ncbi:hypothetical protein DPMN_177441, partial [Dreissena polymorpha]
MLISFISRTADVKFIVYIQQEISQTYAEIKKRNALFVADYLNNHVPVKEFFLDTFKDRTPAAKFVGSESCVRN